MAFKFLFFVWYVNSLLNFEILIKIIKSVNMPRLCLISKVSKVSKVLNHNQAENKSFFKNLISIHYSRLISAR